MKKLFTFLTLVLFALTVQAADEVIFSATVTATADVNFDPGTTEIGSTNATVVGGKVYAVNNQSSAKKLIGKKSDVYYFSMTNNNTYFKITLDKALAVGDVITAKALAGVKNDNPKGIYVSTSEATDGNLNPAPACAGTSPNDGTNDAMIDNLLNYTVTEGSEYVGATTLYVYRAAGATEYWGDFVITRAETPTPPPTPVGTVTDVLTSVGLGATATGGNSYADFTGKTFTSNAVYAANISAGNTAAIQLRSKNSNSGIVSTTSGGKLKKVVLNWADNTALGRIVQIYGSNTAYTAPTDLYGDNKGTLLAELNINDAIETGRVSTLEVTDDYEYVGIRSQADALYLTSVEIEWEGEAAPEQPKLYVIGDGTTNGWDRTAMDEMAYNADTQTYTYQYVTTSPLSFLAIADYQQTADEAAADPEWTDFNTNHRYYIANIDGAPTLDTEFELAKGDGTIKLGAGVYTISVKDMKVTISGEPAPEGTIFYAPMANGLDGFTTEAPTVWSYSSQFNCAYGTAYNKEVVGSFDLVSPVIDLTNKQNAVLTFSHAGKFFTNVAEEAQLLVKLEEDGAQWTPVAIPNHVTNENYNWVESGDIDLSAYNNAQIRIAFRYSNTEANSGGTWEIKNIVVTAKAATPTVEKLYLLGGNAEWKYAGNVEVPFNETAQAWTYEVETAGDHFFAFADKNDCASWDELNGSHRWSLGAGDVVPEINAEYALQNVEGAIKLTAGKYTVTVTKDMKMTVTGEVTPTLPAYIDYPTTAAGITIGGSTEMDAVVKIHNNTDEVKGIKFANGYTTEGALNANFATIEIDGGFKAGDVISIAGAFNNSVETKESAVDIFTLDETSNPVVLFTTQQFVNGRVSANDPAVEKFTLEADYDKLYLGRNGNTATFVTLLKTERTVAPTVEHLYLLGGNQDWTYANNAELPFDETAQAWTYEVNSPEGEHFFAFADKNDCASWDELNGSHRWALEAGDIVPEINAEYALTKANGTVKLPAGQYTVTVTKDMMMTVKAVTDGIKNINADTQNGVIYNLQGQRVYATQKGIYIINGKKVMVK